MFRLPGAVGRRISTSLNRYGTQRLAMAALMTVLGLVLIGLGWVYKSPWQQALFLNAGVAMGLFTALHFFQRMVLEREVVAIRSEQVEQALLIGELGTEVEAVRKEVTALSALGEATRELLARQVVDERSVIDAFRASPSRKATQELLACARRIDAVSETGIRIHLRNTGAYVRFVPVDLALPLMMVHIEDSNCEPYATVRWKIQPPEQLFAEIAVALKKRGEYPGDEAFDSQGTMTALADAVELAIDAKSGRGRASSNLGAVIEVVNVNWAVTDDGLEFLGSKPFVIECSRLHEAGWLEHVRGKVWANFDEFVDAYRAACAVFPASKLEIC